MKPISFERFPSFIKDVFQDIIEQFNFVSIREDSYGIVFENKFMAYGLFMDEVYDVRCVLSIDKNTQAEVTQLLEFAPKEVKKYFYKEMYKIFVENFKNTPIDEIIKSHFLYFFEGKIPNYWKLAINEPKHDYYEMFKTKI
jgi:hypothetical protein